MGAARRREAPFPENAADTGQLSLSERPQYVLRGLVEEDVAFTLCHGRPDKRPQDCRYDQLEVTPAYELDRVFGARDRSQPCAAAGQGS